MKKLMMIAMVGATLGMTSGGDARAEAVKDDMHIHQSRYCTQHFARQERKYGIPKNLLMALAATESGRWHKKAGMALPWPWTANVEGKGYYFETKHEAIVKVNRLRAQGKKSIDVGCMQVNLKHHPDAFASVGVGFSPEHNIAYSAKFLHQLYKEQGSWQKAVAAYHSKTPSKGKAYFARVKKNWLRVLAALGTDGANSPYVRKVEDMELAQENSVIASLQKPDGGSRKRINSTKHYKKKRTARKVPKMKVISVSKKRSSPVEVLVIRPKSAYKAPVEVASARKYSNSNFVMGKQSRSFHKVDVSAGETSSSNVRSARRGPNFIFN